MRNDRAILLINMGSVYAPTTKAVRAFLKEFLSDELVLPLPRWKRWLLLNLIILRFRPKHIAPRYEEIWHGEMSPLHESSCALQEALQREVGEQAHVVVAMRYGEPSILEAMRKLKRLRIRQLAVFPLYPQYAQATTLTALRAVERAMGKEKLFFQTVYNLSPFYAASGYIEALYKSAKPYLEKPFDKLIFSFHSLPKSKAAERYYEQCLSTADAFCKRAGLEKKKTEIAFQSRFGRGEWLGPSTMETLERLPTQGVHRVLAICPSFVADGLESLYEIGIEGARVFSEAGGTQFTLIPCLNAHPCFVKFLAKQSEQAWQE